MRNLAASWQNSPNSRSPDPGGTKKPSWTSTVLPLLPYWGISGTAALTVLVDLLDNLLQRGWLHLESHHGENVADVVRRDGPLLVGKAVEAALQDVDLVAVQAHVVLFGRRDHIG